MVKSILVITLIFTFYTLTAQKEEKLIVSFYNVENLFDTIDQPDVLDEEFTPESEKKWNTEKYSKKIEDIAKVLSSIDNKELPSIIGLAEIENRTVLEDLINTKYLQKANYGIVHQDSPDIRGIDVAILYRKDKVKVLDHEAIPVKLPFDTAFKTRDILYVKFRLADGQDLNVFVNHWSSRREGMKESEPRRMYSGVAVRRKFDLLLSRDIESRFLIMGDFNDEPTNKSIMSILMATNKKKNIGTGDLYNLFYDQHNNDNIGSYNYRNEWNMLDQIIVSYNLINRMNSFSCDYASGKIFKEDWMMYSNEKGEESPNRTYGGPNYYGGVSDHLPVYVEFNF
jgi:predicted extracellular nuclease